MPKLIIDDRKIEVAQGVKVIAAAEQAGIMIPRFCYHPALGSVGACRMCAVKFLDGPIRGLQMSCMVEAKDGMVVSSTDDEAVDFRRFIIELLMLNHPHDCPVCDEGGHCLLQDETISGGHAKRGFMGKKRTHRDQYLGELIQHEMNRCIHCYRCRRFYQEFCGYRDFGVMGIAGRTYFGRYSDGPLENPFSGNLIDICPTGVLTDKPARFRGRRWDFQRAPSLCINCSLGCHTTVSARYHELVRVEARCNDHINGHFICDRGRFGFAFANHPDRPRQARIGVNAATYHDALLAAADRLKAISQSAGPSAIACMGSSRSSIETQMGLKFVAQALNWREPAYFWHRIQQDNVCSAVGRLSPDLAISLREMEHADAILVLGVDPIQEAPMLALAMRQAQRAGATVEVLGFCPVPLPFEYKHWPLSPKALIWVLQELVRASSSGSNAEDRGKAAHFRLDTVVSEASRVQEMSQHFQSLSRMLQNSQRPVIVCGADIVDSSVINAAADLTLRLQAGNKRAGLFYVLPGANAFGAAIASAGSKPFCEILDAIENGQVRALLLAEADPLYHFPSMEHVKRTLEKLELLVVLDYLPNRTLELFRRQPNAMPLQPWASTRIMLPTLTHFETSAGFINQEGRLQHADAVHCGGMPLSQLTGGEHPPRSYRKDIPGTCAKAAWEVLSELEVAMSPSHPVVPSFRDLWCRIEQQLNITSHADCTRMGSEDRLIFPGGSNLPLFTVDSDMSVTNHGSDDSLEPTLMEGCNETDEHSEYSNTLKLVKGLLAFNIFQNKPGIFRQQPSPKKGVQA